jgi:hypothetical protein
MATNDASNKSLLRRFQGPISVLSLLSGSVSMVIGYILVTLGATAYFDMHGFDNLGPASETLTGVESLIIVGVGLIFAFVGYIGYKGFLKFAY